MSATLRSVTTNVSTATTFDVTTPSSGGGAAQVDDILLAFHTNDYYTLSNIQTPTGGDGTWNAITDATADGGTNLAHIKAWWSVITSAGAKTVTFVESGGSTDEDKGGVVCVIGGADTAAAVDVAGNTTGGSNATQTHTGVSPTSSDALLLAVWCSGSGAAAASYTLSGGSIVEQTEFRNAGISGVVGAETLAASGATGSRTATASTAVPFAISLVAIKAGGAVVPRASVPLTHVGSTAWTAPASSTTISPTYPSGLQDATSSQTDIVYAILHVKPDTATIATPTNWSLVTSASGGAGTQAAGTGATRMHLYKRTGAAALSGTTETFTITGGSSPVAFMRAYRASGQNVAFSGETTTSWSVTTASTTIGGTAGASLDIAALDEINCVLGTPDDQSSTLTLTGLTATGATLGALTRDPNATVVNAQGNDISATAYRVPVDAGSSTSAPVATATSSSSETAMGFLFRVRATAEVTARLAVLVAPSMAAIQQANW